MATQVNLYGNWMGAMQPSGCSGAYPPRAHLAGEVGEIGRRRREVVDDSIGIDAQVPAHQDVTEAAG